MEVFDVCRSGDLRLWTFNWKVAVRLLVKWGTYTTILIFARFLVFELRACTGQTDGQRDGRTRRVMQPIGWIESSSSSSSSYVAVMWMTYHLKNHQLQAWMTENGWQFDTTRLAPAGFDVTAAERSGWRPSAELVEHRGYDHQSAALFQNHLYIMPLYRS